MGYLLFFRSRRTSITKLSPAPILMLIHATLGRSDFDEDKGVSIDWTGGEGFGLLPLATVTGKLN